MLVRSQESDINRDGLHRVAGFLPLCSPRVKLCFLRRPWWNSTGCGPDLAVDLKLPRTSSDCGVPLWGFSFNWSGVLWFQSVESLISGFLGGVLFYTHYLRWSLLLARFRIIILKAIGVAHGLHHGPQNGPAKRICARSLWGRGCGQSGNCFSK